MITSKINFTQSPKINNDSEKRRKKEHICSNSRRKNRSINGGKAKIKKGELERSRNKGIPPSIKAMEHKS